MSTYDSRKRGVNAPALRPIDVAGMRVRLDDGREGRIRRAYQPSDDRMRALVTLDDGGEYDTDVSRLEVLSE